MLYSQQKTLLKINHHEILSELGAYKFFKKYVGTKSI